MPRARRLKWAPAAIADLRDIWRYLGEAAALDIADRVVREIEGAIRRLDRLETPGRPREELLPGLRSVLVHPYVIFFRIGDDRLEIIRILHERRDVSAFLRPTYQ